jgi:hypothetical protein
MGRREAAYPAEARGETRGLACTYATAANQDRRGPNNLGRSIIYFIGRLFVLCKTRPS